MINMDWTSIVLGVLTLLGGCGWLIDRKKHHEEIRSLKADIKQKELNLGTDFVREFRTLIVEPLKREVNELRNEVKELRDAVREINNCDFSSNCPVRDRLQYTQGGAHQRRTEGGADDDEGQCTDGAGGREGYAERGDDGDGAPESG